MGSRKFRLGSLPKNYERKCKGQRLVGRPRKSVQKSMSNQSSNICAPEPSNSEETSTDKSLDTSRRHQSPSPCRTSESSSNIRAPESSNSEQTGIDKLLDTSAHHLPPTPTSSTSAVSTISSSSFISSSESSTFLLLPSNCRDRSLTPSSVSSFSSTDSSFSCTTSTTVSSLDESLPTPSGLHSLVTDLVLPDKHWILRNEDDVAIYKLSNHSSSLVITHCVRIKADLTWTLSVHGVEVCTKKCDLLSSVSKHLCQRSLVEFLNLLDSWKVCPGHPDKSFVEMVEAKKGRLMSKSGKSISATVDSFSPVFVSGKEYAKTVRVSTCEMLVNGNKCSSCVSYRDSLRRMFHRWQKQKSLSPSKRQSTRSRTNMRWLNTPEKTKRYSQLRSRLEAKSKEAKRLKDKINHMIEKNHVSLDEDLHSDFRGIMLEMSKKVQEEYPDNSFRRLFWEEQLKAAGVKNNRQVRWHPAILKWCLHLKFISSGGYHALRSSGLLTLPSERTLRDYTHCIRAGVGFIPEVDAQLVKEADIVSDKDGFVVLSWDEMKIKEDLIFDKQSCNLVGFTNIGEINDLLDQVEQQADGRRHNNVSSHILLFMVRGMFSSLEFPYAHFATRGVSADSLYPIVWEGVQRLECCGMNVIAFCCDGASPNRKFYKMHGKPGELTYKTPNPFHEDMDIYFICDVPHLLKTTRNCWSNSFANKYSRALWKDGKHITWSHLVTLYNKNRTASGLSLVPKLRRDHVYLTSYSRMRVNLAAQVLSSSVAHALEYFGDDDTAETITFIKHFDRFFDCFNVRCLKEGMQKLKPDLHPYTDPSDPRLQWLVDGFLKYLQDWEDCVQSREGFSKSEMQKMLLSNQTREGLKITVHSFVEMAPCLLSIPGVQFILSEKLCQDPLEAFFGKQRAAGGRCDNPTVRQFCHNTVSLRLQGSAALEPVRGNCGKRPTSSNHDIVELSQPLQKRPRHSKY